MKPRHPRHQNTGTHAALNKPLPAMCCDKCNGYGRFQQPLPGTKGWETMGILPCPKCNGTGFAVQQPKTLH